MEPKNVHETLTDSDWIIAVQDELHQFERNQVWHLVPKPKDRIIIGTKWVFRNKLDEQGTAETRHDWLSKGTIRKKALIMKRHLHQLQELRP